MQDMCQICNQTYIQCHCVNSIMALMKTLINLPKIKSEYIDRERKTDIRIRKRPEVLSVYNSLTQRIFEKIIKYLPTGAEKITSLTEKLQSDNSENWSNATTTIRRILADFINIIDPQNLNSKPIEERLKKNIKNKKYNLMLKAHIKFIFNEASKGTHGNATKEDVEKLLIHVCLFLDEIDWHTVSTQTKNEEKLNEK